MYKSSQAAAEAHFVRKQKQSKLIKKEKNKEQQARRDRMAQLKALRLSHEQSGKE